MRLRLAVPLRTSLVLRRWAWEGRNSSPCGKGRGEAAWLAGRRGGTGRARLLTAQPNRAGEGRQPTSRRRGKEGVAQLAVSKREGEEAGRPAGLRGRQGKVSTTRRRGGRGVVRGGVPVAVVGAEFCDGRREATIQFIPIRRGEAPHSRRAILVQVQFFGTGPQYQFQIL